MAATSSRKVISTRGNGFHQMGLDDRLLKAIAILKWAKPTLIQEKAIPLALSGKDILARGRTGSGKTGSFAIPVIQKILTEMESDTEASVRALIIVPTRELCHQAHKNFLELTRCCSKDVKCIDISGQSDINAMRPLLMEKPAIVVATPSRALAHLQAENLDLKQSLSILVIDEADLVFSFGYESDIKSILGFLPKIYQAFLTSATFNDDVKSLKKLVLHNPVTLRLEESQLPQSDKLQQFHIKCENEDKFVFTYTILKLGLLKGKSILFVSTIERGYRLKLFLEQFQIMACVLNRELPINSRCHIVNQFNKGKYDNLIATDEGAFSIEKLSNSSGYDDPSVNRRGKQKFQKKDKEFGVARGIDFQEVSNIINFDFPHDLDAYVHRVGRTARGDSEGVALSYITMKDVKRFQEIELKLRIEMGVETSVIKKFKFKTDEIEGFRYRAKDALRAVTKISVKEARLKEIKQEMLNSQKLKTYFEDNPKDLEVLRHDKPLFPQKIKPHLKNVPDYLVPSGLKESYAQKRASEEAMAELLKEQPPEKKRRRMRTKKKSEDPLKTLTYSKKTKSL